MKKFIVFGILAMGFAVVSQAQTPATQPAPTKSCCKKEGAAGCNKPAAGTAAATPTKSCCKKEGSAACSGHASASAASASAPAPEPTTAATPVPVSKSDKKK